MPTDSEADIVMFAELVRRAGPNRWVELSSEEIALALRRRDLIEGLCASGGWISAAAAAKYGLTLPQAFS